MPFIDPDVAERVERLELPFNRYGLDHYGIDKGYLRGFFSFLTFISQRWLTVNAYGVEHVPTQGRAMIVGNHSGGVALDGAMHPACGVGGQSTGQGGVAPVRGSGGVR